MKLFPKLALAISVLLIGTLVSVTLSIYWTEERQMRYEAGQERMAVLHNLVHIAQESFLTNDDLLLVKYTRWLAKWNPTLVSASVADPNGSILSHSEPSRIGQQVGAPQTATAQVLVLSEPVRLGATWKATASAAFSEKVMEQTLRDRRIQLQRRLGEIAFILVLLGFGVSLGLASSWTRPIAQLAMLTEKVGRGCRDLDLGSIPRRRDEIGRLAYAFQLMGEQLQQLDTMKEDFVSAVTHELRSPLGAIESYLNLISQELHEGIPISAWENYLERLRINTQRLTRFVNDLLDVAALERGKIKLECRHMSLMALAEDVMGLFALKLKEKGLSYRVIGSAGDPDVYADPEKIHQVLVNLVSNAIKYTSPRGRVVIEIINSKNPTGLCVKIRDTGIGISETDQSKIFNKFEQVPSARRGIQGPKGTGLGLAISRSLVELHGQTLQVDSRVGEGSTFFFTLPFAPTELTILH